MGNVSTIGIIGGGQLGRMLTLAAKPMGFNVVVLDSSKDCPAGQVGAKVIVGGLYDPEAIKKLSKAADVITIEIEHLDTVALEAEATAGKPVHPAPSTIRMIQDKYRQKQVLKKNGIATADFKETSTKADALSALKEFGGKMILKARHGAYDGRGNALVRNKKDLDSAWTALGGKKLYAEKLVDFTKELSVIIARSATGEVKIYDTVEMEHERNICLEVTAPAQISTKATSASSSLAKKTSKILEGAGVFAIEMFLVKDGSVLVNEIAPRVHNSGHHTIESCFTSQFEQHIRAVAGLPLGETGLISPAVMVNILGTTEGHAKIDPKPVLEQPFTSIHWYGKSPVKVDRKMGHITSLGTNLEKARKHAKQAREGLNI